MPDEINPRFIADMANAIRSLSAVVWRQQGRINALELICLQTIEDAARLHDDPKGYMRHYVERARARALPLADVDDPAKTEQTKDGGGIGLPRSGARAAGRTAQSFHSLNVQRR